LLTFTLLKVIPYHCLPYSKRLYLRIFKALRRKRKKKEDEDS